MLITQLKPDEALVSLRSQASGLAAVEARRRIAEYGSNRIEEVARTPLVVRLLREFAHFFAIILWVLEELRKAFLRRRSRIA